MRTLMLAMIGLAAISAAPVSAQTYSDDYPVCLQVFGPLNYSECRYFSVAQCRLSASGRAAQCIENPYFVTRPPTRQRRERKYRRR